MKTLNLVMYPSAFQHESRILKETESVVRLGLIDDVLIVALWKEGLAENEAIDSHRTVWRVRLKLSFARKILPVEIAKYAELLFRIVMRTRGCNVTVVSCHSLSMLPIGVLLRTLKGARLVYDTHELETERTGLRGLRKAFSKVVERLAMPFVDKLVVTSRGYASWYRQAYNRPEIYVFDNVPLLRKSNSEASRKLRDRYSIPENETIFLYHGLLTRGRSIETMLETFVNVSPDKHLVLMGYGDLITMAQEYAAKFKNIHFLSAVPPEQVMEYAASADVGICLIENVSLSYFHSSPNKVFEYIHSGVPVIVSNFPDMSKIIDDFGCGWKISVSIAALRQTIDSLTREEIQFKKAAAVGCRHHFCWTKHDPDIREIYRRHDAAFKDVSNSRARLPL